LEIDEQQVRAEDQQQNLVAGGAGDTQKAKYTAEPGSAQRAPRPPDCRVEAEERCLESQQPRLESLDRRHPYEYRIRPYGGDRSENDERPQGHHDPAPGADVHEAKLVRRKIHSTAAHPCSPFCRSARTLPTISFIACRSRPPGTR